MAWTVRGMRRRWLDEWADSHRVSRDKRTLAGDVYRTAEWRKGTAQRTHSAFGSRCFVCGATERLESAHILYPATGPGTEVIDADDINQSDMVLLCADHHSLLDEDSRMLSMQTRDELRAAILELLEDLV